MNSKNIVVGIGCCGGKPNNRVLLEIDSHTIKEFEDMPKRVQPPFLRHLGHCPNIYRKISILRFIFYKTLILQQIHV